MRRFCDAQGFKDCELIVDEWHFFGEYNWGELRSPDPAVRRRVWEGPAGHNGIDSSCFNLSLLSRLQTSKLDQAYYYGCRHMGAWGYMDESQNKYKVYYGLKAFGDFLKRHQILCESKAEGGLAVLAAKSESDAFKKGLIVTDYRTGATEITVEVEGVDSWHGPVVWVHDNTRDFARVPARLIDGKIVLKKADANSAAFIVWF